MRIKTSYSKSFKIVGDGVLSAPEIGEGRFIPLLIIDAKKEAEIIDLIALHKGSPPGDAKFTWSRPLWDTKKIVLDIEFEKPMKSAFEIEFDLKTQYSLVDGIIQSRGFFLQVGEIGDKPSTLTTDKILLEVPDMGFDTRWNGILIDAIKSFYKRQHLSKKNVLNAASKHISSMREFWKIRRPN